MEVKTRRGTEELNFRTLMMLFTNGTGRERNIPISGPMLQEEARLIAERLENSRFKPSNGWLQSFKARHNLKMLTVCVE